MPKDVPLLVKMSHTAKKNKRLTLEQAQQLVISLNIAKKEQTANTIARQKARSVPEYRQRAR